MAGEFKIKTGLLLGAPTTQPVTSIKDTSISITTDASSILVTGKAVYDFVTTQTPEMVQDPSKADWYNGGTSNMIIGKYELGGTGSYNTALGDNALNSGILNNADGNVAIGTNSLKNLIFGNYNVAIGYNALNDISIGTGSTAIGYSAGENSIVSNGVYVGINAGANNTGTETTGVGYSALYSNSGQRSVGVGTSALFANEGGNSSGIGYYAAGDNTGSYATAMGSSSLRLNEGDYASAIGGRSGENNIGDFVILGGYQSGFNNEGDQAVLIGNNAGYINTGSYTIGIGKDAGYDISGSYNIALGYRTLHNSSGHHNVALGYDSGYNMGSGAYNFSVGYNSMKGDASGITGSSNIAIGPNTLELIKSGTDNIALGKYSLQLGTAGSQNIALGYEALRYNNSTYNIAIGRDSASRSTDSYNSISIGNGAGQYSEATSAVAIGVSALRGASGKGATGAGVIAIGVSALSRLETGNSNVAIGANALADVSSGVENTAIGNAAGGNITSSQNTFIGAGTATYTLGDANTAVGHYAMWRYDSGGSGNVALGKSALTYGGGNNNIGIGNTVWFLGGGTRVGDNNIALGQSAFYRQTGSNNIALGLSVRADAIGDKNINIGDSAGRFLEGNYNTGIGEFSHYDKTGEYNVGLGYRAGSQADGSNNLFLGNWAGNGIDGDDMLFVTNAVGETENTAIIYGEFSGNQLLRFNVSDLEFNGISEVSTGYVLYYNPTTHGVTYAEASTAGSIGASTLNALTDVSVGITIPDGSVLTWDLVNSEWTYGPAGISSIDWGDINGSISDQTDISTALDGKLNLTGGTISGDLEVGGDFIVDGSMYIIGVETIDVSSAYIYMNTGLTGSAPNTMQSGIIVGRGSDDPYAILYDETYEQFRIGITTWNGSQYSDGSTQAVATRQDAPTTNGIAYWNAIEDRFDTSTNFTTNGKDVSIGGNVYMPGLAEVSTGQIVYYNTVSGLLTYADASTAGGGDSYWTLDGSTLIPTDSTVDVKLGAIDIGTDAGAVTLVDMDVSSATVGTEESYSFNMDGSVAMKIYGKADGAGTLSETAVVIEATYQYMGDPDTNGSWRFGVDSAGDLVFEKRISGTWTEKGKFTE